VDAWLDVSLEEYKTLRGESPAGIEQIQRTFQIGVVALGVIAGFAADAAGTEPATGSEYLQRIRGKTLSQIRQKALADPHST
jgi:hypothetical protein